MLVQQAPKTARSACMKSAAILASRVRLRRQGAQRLAAALARRAGIASRLAGLGPPVYKRTENDRLPRPPGLAELLEAHGAFRKAIPAFNDSS